MPACVKCGRVDTSAEMRRRRGHDGERVCRDLNACSRRVAQPRVDALEAVRELSVKRRELECALGEAMRAARELDKPVAFRELAQLTGLSEWDVRQRVTPLIASRS